VNSRRILILGIVISLIATAWVLIPEPRPALQEPDPGLPDSPVKLIFIHHSTGENWLADGYGNLGRELAANNYFVSDTNYGWGPNGIGDNTDIPSWMEWFRGAETPTYMNALLNESGQNADYTRTFSDPGGENSIIMFKSCFPNSELTGSPNDPPGTYEDLSVGGAKYVYNQLLQFFTSRPDKLFIVITAPPLSDGTYARNARAFNLWLVNDWLNENQYALDNVAVFDFYNILTGPDAHHRYINGSVEYIQGSRDTLYYPSGDDHPSEKGSRKATEEFIPMLNSFYNQWIQPAPAQAPDGGTESQPVPAEQGPAAAPVNASVIDGFEGSTPPGTNGWESFRDESTSTVVNCRVQGEVTYNGSGAKELDFNVAVNSWATCALFFEEEQNWSSSDGIGFYLRAETSGLVFNLDIYAGSPDAQETYAYQIETPPDSASGWIPFFINWSDFHRVDWEENAGSPFDKPGRITGFAFGFETYPDTPNTGRIWVDDISLADQAAALPPDENQSGGDDGTGEAAQQESSRRRLPCGSALAVPLAFIGFLLNKRIFSVFL